MEMPETAKAIKESVEIPTEFGYAYYSALGASRARADSVSERTDSTPDYAIPLPYRQAYMEGYEKTRRENV